MAPTTSPLSQQFNSLQTTKTTKTTKTTRDPAKPNQIAVFSVRETTELTHRRSSSFNFGAAQKSPTLAPSQQNGFIANAEISKTAPQHFHTHSLPSHNVVCRPAEHRYQAATIPKTNPYFSLPEIPPPDYPNAPQPKTSPPDPPNPPRPRIQRPDPIIPPPDYPNPPHSRIQRPDPLSFATLQPARKIQTPSNLLRSNSEATPASATLHVRHVPIKPYVTVLALDDSPPMRPFSALSTPAMPQLSDNHGNHLLPAEEMQAPLQHLHQQTIGENISQDLPLPYQPTSLRIWVGGSMTSLATQQSSNHAPTTPTVDYTCDSSTCTEQTPSAHTNQSDNDTSILQRVPSNRQRDRIKAWLRDLTYENRRRERIDPTKLIAIREHIQNIYSNKKYHRHPLLWDASASCQYHQEALKFYEAAGVSIDEQGKATRHCAKAGELYALSQLPVFPTRLMGAALKLHAFNSEHAAKSWMMARSGLHANIGGLLSPMWDALSTLAKHGRPIPADEYWNVPSRRHVVSKLKQCLEQSEHALKICQERECAVPTEVIKILEQARTLYKMVNAKGYCYSAPSTISSATEFIKTTIDIVVSAATAGYSEPVVRSALNACTALIYAFICPCEEVAAMDQIRMQNAKYANIFQEDNKTVDIEKVMNLWQGKRQTEAAYIERAVERHFEKYLYKIEHAKERLSFLNEALTMPNEEALAQLHQRTACDAAISFIQTQIAALRPQVNKSAAQDADWLLQLSRANIDESLLKSFSQAPQTHRSILNNPMAPGNLPKRISADRLSSEQKKYTPSHTTAEDQYNASIRQIVQRLSHEENDEMPTMRESQNMNHDINETSTSDEMPAMPESQNMTQDTTKSKTTDSSLISFVQHLSNGKYLLKALERDLAQLIEEKEELKKLQEQANNTSQNSHSTPLDNQHLREKIIEKINRDIHHQEKKRELYLDKLKRLIGDYQVFRNLKNLAEPHDKKTTIGINDSLNLLDSTGLIAGMLCSGNKLRIEAIKSEYAYPGAISSRIIERVPLSIALSALFGLNATPEHQFGEGATVLDWLHNAPPKILNQAQSGLAAEYVGATVIAGSIQELCRLQAHRLANIENYLRNLDLCNTTNPNTRSALNNIAPSIRLSEAHYLPDFSNFRTYTQAHRLARNHPESNALRGETIKNFALANIRTGTFGLRDLALRLFIDLQGLYVNKETKQLLNQINSYNKNVGSELSFVTDKNGFLFPPSDTAEIESMTLDHLQEPSMSATPQSGINRGYDSFANSSTNFESQPLFDANYFMLPPSLAPKMMDTESDTHPESLVFAPSNIRMRHTNTHLNDYPVDGSQRKSEA